MIKFFLAEIADKYIRDNFQRITDYFSKDVFSKSQFSFFEYTFGAAATSIDVSHNAGFVPLDVIMLSVTNGETVTFHYDNFTRTTLRVTATGACRVRAFIGRHAEGVTA